MYMSPSYSIYTTFFSIAACWCYEVCYKKSVKLEWLRTRFMDNFFWPLSLVYHQFIIYVSRNSLSFFFKPNVFFKQNTDTMSEELFIIWVTDVKKNMIKGKLQSKLIEWWLKQSSIKGNLISRNTVLNMGS